MASNDITLWSERLANKYSSISKTKVHTGTTVENCSSSNSDDDDSQESEGHPDEQQRNDNSDSVSSQSDRNVGENYQSMKNVGLNNESSNKSASCGDSSDSESEMDDQKASNSDDSEDTKSNLQRMRPLNQRNTDNVNQEAPDSDESENSEIDSSNDHESDTENSDGDSEDSSKSKSSGIEKEHFVCKFNSKVSQSRRELEKDTSSDSESSSEESEEELLEKNLPKKGIPTMQVQKSSSSDDSSSDSEASESDDSSEIKSPEFDAVGENKILKKGVTRSSHSDRDGAQCVKRVDDSSDVSNSSKTVKLKKENDNIEERKYPSRKAGEAKKADVLNRKTVPKRYTKNTKNNAVILKAEGKNNTTIDDSDIDEDTSIKRQRKRKQSVSIVVPQPPALPVEDFIKEANITPILKSGINQKVASQQLKCKGVGILPSSLFDELKSGVKLKEVNPNQHKTSDGNISKSNPATESTPNISRKPDLNDTPSAQSTKTLEDLELEELETKMRIIELQKRKLSSSLNKSPSNVAAPAVSTCKEDSKKNINPYQNVNTEPPKEVSQNASKLEGCAKGNSIEAKGYNQKIINASKECSKLILRDISDQFALLMRDVKAGNFHLRPIQPVNGNINILNQPPDLREMLNRAIILRRDARDEESDSALDDSPESESDWEEGEPIKA